MCVYVPHDGISTLIVRCRMRTTSDTTITMKRRKMKMIGKRNGNRVASSEALKSGMAVGGLVCVARSKQYCAMSIGYPEFIVS